MPSMQKLLYAASFVVVSFLPSLALQITERDWREHVASQQEIIARLAERQEQVSRRLTLSEEDRLALHKLVEIQTERLVRLEDHEITARWLLPLMFSGVGGFLWWWMKRADKLIWRVLSELRAPSQNHEVED